MSPPLSSAGTEAFYDRFGAWMDRQAFYEDVALDCLVAGADLGGARRVFEFGCGTGRFAERLLARELPAEASYVGVDVSSTMVGLASRRLARFGARSEVRRTDGSTGLPFPTGTFDRFLSTNVVDLLAEDQIGSLLAEARRLLSPGGTLGLVSLTRGRRPLPWLVSTVWAGVHALRPTLVGGCRPLNLRRFVEPGHWQVVSHEVVSRWAVPSEVVVATRR